MASHFQRRGGGLPLLHQAEAAECGLACLAMVSSFHGHRLDLEEARRCFRISLKGTTLADLVRFARGLHLAARPLRLEPDALARLQCPAILHFDMNHFVVLKEMRGHDAIVHDPALGLRRLDPAQLGRRFTGVALEFSPAPGFETRAARPPMRLAELIGHVPATRALLPRALALSFGFQLLALAAPLYVQLAVDRGVAQGAPDALAPLAAGFALLVLLRGGLGWVRAQVLLAFAGLANAQLMANIVRRMLRLPHAWFERRHIASLLSRVASTQPIKDLIADGLAAALVDGAMALLTIAAAAMFAPGLALVVLAGFALSALVKWWQVRSSLGAENAYIEAFAKAQQELIETLRGIASVKLFGAEAGREVRWSDRNVETVNARYAADAVRAKADLYRDIIQSLVLAWIVYAGARQAIAGTTSLGVLMALITWQQMFAASSARLLDFAGRLRLLGIHLDRLADIVLAEPEHDDLPAFAEPRALAGRISAEGLGFAYGALEEPVLHGIGLDVAAGEFVAITGPSGGGKTTLLKLLVGLLEPDRGSVCYDGRPLATIGHAALRSQIAVVMQDDILLSGSIAQNISFFEPRPDLDWLRECARMAAIDADIAAFPMGYGTLVGDMGTVLSGGQRQRVLLARALYRRPRILFVDEGTSSLDLAREQEINAHLKAMTMTRIVIAHRRDTIAAADRILELSADGLRPLQ
jgi:ATP-binding cassette subfamily B protein RaxB